MKSLKSFQGNLCCPQIPWLENSPQASKYSLIKSSSESTLWKTYFTSPLRILNKKQLSRTRSHAEQWQGNYRREQIQFLFKERFQLQSFSQYLSSKLLSMAWTSDCCGFHSFPFLKKSIYCEYSFCTYYCILCGVYVCVCVFRGF